MNAYLVWQIALSIALLIVGFGGMDEANKLGDKGVPLGWVAYGCIAAFVVSWIVFFTVAFVDAIGLSIKGML